MSLPRHVQLRDHPHRRALTVDGDDGIFLAQRVETTPSGDDGHLTPEEEPVERIPFAEKEVQENETLVMAGYGDDPRFRDHPWLRYFRHNKVTKVHGSAEGRIRYEQQGAFVYNGYTGGPCFREDAGGRWLVGIASAGTEQELAFTSTYFFRDWLRAELQRVAAADTSSAPPAAHHPQ